MPFRLTTLALTLAVAGNCLAAEPAVVAIGNATRGPVRFQVSGPDGEPRAEALPEGQTRRYPVGRTPAIRYTPGAKAAEVRFALDPYSAYLFAPGEGGEITLQGVELAAALPRPDDVPVSAKDEKPVAVKVRLAVDDAEVRSQAQWEKALKARVADASAILERHANVRLEVVGVGEWAADPAAATLAASLPQLERRVEPKGAALVLGFTAHPLGLKRGEKPPEGERYGVGRGPFSRHILLRDHAPATEPERVEALVHEVARWLGATGIPDPRSVMRPRLGDGRAVLARHPVQFDALNLLVVNLWAKQLRTGELRTWADFPPADRDRLHALYKTLAAVDPKEPTAAEHLAVLARLSEPLAAVPAPAEGKPADDKPDPKRAATRLVVRAITARATALKALPPAERPKGDRLTAEYVRAAAMAAEGEHAQAAFLIGLGVGLDDSVILRDNLLTRNLCRAVEPDAERRERLAVLGLPSLRGRRDLCQHFAVSAALTEIVGPGPAEAAGVSKEVMDLAGESGFSFVDLAADLAGIQFAQAIKADPAMLARQRDGFDPDAALPPITGLREGLTPKRFEADYGTVSDPRFLAELEAVRKRVGEHTGYTTPPAAKDKK